MKNSIIQLHYYLEMCIQYTKFFNSTCSLNSIDRSRVGHKLTETIPGRQTKKKQTIN